MMCIFMCVFTLGGQLPVCFLQPRNFLSISRAYTSLAWIWLVHSCIQRATGSVLNTHLGHTLCNSNQHTRQELSRLLFGVWFDSLGYSVDVAAIFHSCNPFFFRYCRCVMQIIQIWFRAINVRQYIRGLKRMTKRNGLQPTTIKSVIRFVLSITWIWTTI